MNTPEGAPVRKVRSTFALLLAIALGLSLAVPPGALTETPFDESETQPYESTPLFLIVVRQVAARAAEDGLTCVSPLRFAPLTESCGCHLQYERVPAHPDSDSLTIFNCSLRC
jgi:hypothetical protein